MCSFCPKRFRLEWCDSGLQIEIYSPTIFICDAGLVVFPSLKFSHLIYAKADEISKRESIHVNAFQQLNNRMYSSIIDKIIPLHVYILLSAPISFLQFECIKECKEIQIDHHSLFHAFSCFSIYFQCFFIVCFSVLGDFMFWWLQASETFNAVGGNGESAGLGDADASAEAQELATEALVEVLEVINAQEAGSVTIFSCSGSKHDSNNSTTNHWNHLCGGRNFEMFWESARQQNCR